MKAKFFDTTISLLKREIEVIKYTEEYSLYFEELLHAEVADCTSIGILKVLPNKRKQKTLYDKRLL